MNSPVEFYIVSTPIGNLSDMSQRAIETLREVDVILCEDTRVTNKLCVHYDIKTPRESYHSHSTDVKESNITSRIKKGIVFALVSDAGTPVISDPGVKLISQIRKECNESVNIISIPGATALITALVTTGFSGNDFRFFGFIPHKKGRTSFFNEIAEHKSIAICYESPHRIIKTLDSLTKIESLNDRELCVARELTKKFEQKVFGTPREVFEYFKNNEDKIKGEFVLVFDKK